MNSEKKRAKWSEIETGLKLSNPAERDLEWGRLRQEFYDKYGELELPYRDKEKLVELKDAYKGNRIFIVGNGPSINNTPLELLMNEFTFAVNRFYLLYDKIDWKPTFYTALDWRVVPDIAREINGLTGSTFFFDERFRGVLREGGDVYYYAHAPADPNYSDERSFAYDISRGVRGAGSVVGSAIQLAYFMGFDPIYLIGCDLGYKVLDSVKQEGIDKFGNGVKLELTSTNDDDPNHFDSRYFGKGKRWHDPNVKRMIDGHIQCKTAIEKKGRYIFNATVGGELEVYKRIQFQSLFKEDISPIYERNACAHLDEADLIAKTFNKKKNGVMLDIGAHHGSSAANFVDDDWKIYCFEPDPNNRKFLIKRFTKRENVVIDSRALGENKCSGQPYYTSDVSSGISGMLAFDQSHKQEGVVEVTTVEQTINEQKIKHIDFLKIDVEGYDYSVLKGVPWGQIKPDVVECEFEDNKTNQLGHTWRDICEYLVEKGYTVYVSEWHPIIRYGIRHDWLGLKKYPCELEDTNAWGNLLAFMSDPGDTVIQEALSKVLKVEKPEKIINTPESQDKSQYAGKVVPFSSEVKQVPTELSKSVSQMKKKKVKARIFPRFSSYAQFAESIQRENLTLFRMGQFVMWVIRFLKRHPIAAVFALTMLVALIGAPLSFQQLAIYGMYFWFAAGLLLISSISIMGISFGNKKMMEFSEREYRYRQALRAEMMRELQKGQNDLSTQLEGQGQQQEVLTTVVNELKTQGEKLSQSQDDLSTQLEGQGQQQTTHEETLDRRFNRVVASAPVFNFGDYQSFNRRLTKANVDILLQEWSRKLSLKLTPKSLAYLAHRICTLESTLKGRLATTIEDIILRVLVASAVKNKNCRVLEIGTLFGIGLASIYEYTNSRFNSVHLTAIDPLDGYYGKDVRDIVTDEIINEPTFRSNLAAAGISEHDYTLIKSMSTEDSAIESAIKPLHDVLVIDGDHSYAGVKADFVNYLPAVKRGGYIIFDDYDAPDWPDVKTFVDTTVASTAEVALVGTSWRTAVFRVVKKPAATKPQPEAPKRNTRKAKNSSSDQG